MKSDAELIAEWLAKNKPTRCPPGIGLGCAVLVKRQAVGASRDGVRRASANRRKVLATLALAREPLTVLGIQDASGISYDQLRNGLLRGLLDDGLLVRTSRNLPERTFFYQLASANSDARSEVA